MSGEPGERTLLVLSQVYRPDPASVGQHMADAAAAMVKRGWRVVVITANRGYDDPRVRYPARETLDGVDIRRLPFASFGKRSLVIRLLGGLSFVGQAIVRSLLLRRIHAILVSTSPPMASVAALAVGWLHGAPIKYWVMDLNPDQAIALGMARAGSVPVRLFEWLNARILSRAADVIVLDRFMADRVARKLDVRHKLAIVPPWPHEDHLGPVAHADNPFRREEGLNGKFVVMYSGNHGPSNPISTVLRAAVRLRDDPRILFLFVGGGVGKREVEAVESPNIRSLPYQPLARLRYSLSAADVHLVTLGDAVVGIVHPCKVYGAMAVARPVVLVGPDESHIGDILREGQVGWQIAHGDVDGAVRLFRALADGGAAPLQARGARARDLLRAQLGKTALCGRLCDLLERGT